MKIDAGFCSIEAKMLVKTRHESHESNFWTRLGSDSARLASAREHTRLVAMFIAKHESKIDKNLLYFYSQFITMAE